MVSGKLPPSQEFQRFSDRYKSWSRTPPLPPALATQIELVRCRTSARLQRTGVSAGLQPLFGSFIGWMTIAMYYRCEMGYMPERDKVVLGSESAIWVRFGCHVPDGPRPGKLEGMVVYFISRMSFLGY